MTRTGTEPEPAGLTAVQVVASEHPTAVAGVPPKVTPTAPGAELNPLPVIVTTVPPAARPREGASS